MPQTTARSATEMIKSFELDISSCKQDPPRPNTQVSIAPFLQEILAYLHNLERYVHQRILETRRRVEERLANCPPNFTMRSNEHYISVAPFDNFLGPSLDPTFSALQSEGTGPFRHRVK